MKGEILIFEKIIFFLKISEEASAKDTSKFPPGTCTALELRHK